MAGVVHPFGGNRSTARLTGAASIAAAVSFLPGAAMQQATGWYPLQALETDNIGAWLTAMEGVYDTAVLAVWLSLVGAPLPLVWFLLTGIVILRAERRAEIQTSTL